MSARTTLSDFWWSASRRPRWHTASSAVHPCRRASLGRRRGGALLTIDRRARWEGRSPAASWLPGFPASRYHWLLPIRVAGTAPTEKQHARRNDGALA